MFTLVNAVLLRGLPFDQPDRIISIGRTDARGASDRRLAPRLPRLAARAAAPFAGLTLILVTRGNVSDEGRPPEQFHGTYQSANMFRLIGQRPMHRARFPPGGRQAGAAPAVILGNGIWKNRYGGDPADSHPHRSR